MMKHTYISVIALFTLLALFGAMPAQAQQRERCFAATGYCIAGPIQRFWEQHGGLAVFGYPLTPLQTEVIEGRRVQVQWFERHRLELHPELAWPYTVQLGRLGIERLARDGRSPVLPAAGQAAAGCRFFGDTGLNVCGDILRAWAANGIENDGRAGYSVAESLALWGLPITEARPETLADGREYIVQWFERARLEIHPEQPAPFRVLGGLLGAELKPQAQAAPQAIRAVPQRIVAPAQNIDSPIVSVGLDPQGVPIVPRHDVGWYNLSATPGEGENIVLWGHVLRFRDAPSIPAPFARIKDLVPGDIITLHTSTGQRFDYVVSQQIWVKPDEVHYILPQQQELLTLVSCIGDQVIVQNEVVDMTHRLITIAKPVTGR
ncbi:sortase [Candidatus Chloroploca mongolica]|nr:class F sortase [Candidatus Chloroploca mongolica]